MTATDVISIVATSAALLGVIVSVLYAAVRMDVSIKQLVATVADIRKVLKDLSERVVDQSQLTKSHGQRIDRLERLFFDAGERDETNGIQ